MYGTGTKANFNVYVGIKEQNDIKLKCPVKINFWFLPLER